MKVTIIRGVSIVDELGKPIDVRPRTAKVLGVLALRTPAAVSVGDLIDAVWDDPPPASAEKGVQNAIVELRRILGSTSVERNINGYRLNLSSKAHSLDLDILKTLAAATDGASIDAALAMLDGELLPDFGGDHAVSAFVARLTFLRSDLEERRVDYFLAAGEHATAAREAAECVSTAPTRERRWEQLALALYRCGRQSDALRSLAEARHVLRVTCGLSPGPELIKLEARILAQDPSLSGLQRDCEPDPTSTIMLHDAQAAVDSLQPDWFDTALATIRTALSADRVEVARAAAALVGVPDTGLGRTWRDRQRSAAVGAVLTDDETGASSLADPTERLLHARLLTNQALTSTDVDAEHLQWQKSRALAALDVLDTIMDPARVNVGATVAVLQGCHSALLGPEHVARRKSCTERMVELARCFEQPAVIVAAGLASIVDAAEAGDLVVVDQWLDALDGLRDELPLLTWNREVIRSARRFSQGRFEKSKHAASAARHAPGADSHPVADLIYFVQQLCIHDASGTLNALLPSPTKGDFDHSLGDPLLALNALLHGNTRAATDSLVTARSNCFADLKADYLYQTNLKNWAEVALALRDREAAAVLRDRCAKLHVRFTASRIANFGVPVESILGRLTALLGAYEESIAHHRNAVRQVRRARADYLVADALAWLALDLSMMPEVSRIAALKVEAVDAAQEAVTLASNQGAVVVERRARAALATFAS